MGSPATDPAPPLSILTQAFRLSSQGYTIKVLKWAGSTFNIKLSSDETVITRRAGDSSSSSASATVEIAPPDPD
jgi:hypothetical protein